MEGEFEAFRGWAVRSGWKPRLCLGRIRIRGPYSPGNCEWVTRGEMSGRYGGVVTLSGTACNPNGEAEAWIARYEESLSGEPGDSTKLK